ncbi:hypothetical protein RAA17_11305 [Komagataeibacter rhaeticus]|nr:hypothetical protein [Komagataeibacter rhaeticus]
MRPPWRARLANRFGVYANVPRMFRQIWRCSPALTLGGIALRLIQAVQPSLALYVGKLIVDEVIRLGSQSTPPASLLAWSLHGPASRLEGWIALEFMLIILSDLTARATTLVDGLLNERYINDVSLSLMGHAATLDLQQFESSELQDLLERARRQASGRNNLLVQLFNIAEIGLTALTLAAGVMAFAPWMVLLLVLALLPATAGEAHFNAEGYRLLRARTAERREMDYLRHIGSTAEHAKELRLFGLELSGRAVPRRRRHGHGAEPQAGAAPLCLEQGVRGHWLGRLLRGVYRDCVGYGAGTVFGRGPDVPVRLVPAAAYHPVQAAHGHYPDRQPGAVSG